MSTANTRGKEPLAREMSSNDVLFSLYVKSGTQSWIGLDTTNLLDLVIL